MQVVAILLACLGYGIYAIAKRSLSIAPRRKVIDAPAIWVGTTLITLPFIAVIVFFAWRKVAATYYPSSHLADQYSVLGPMIFFLLSIAVTLSLANRWSVPKYYEGTWQAYTPHTPQKPRKRTPDFSMLDASDGSESADSANDR